MQRQWLMMISNACLESKWARPLPRQRGRKCADCTISLYTSGGRSERLSCEAAKRGRGRHGGRVQEGRRPGAAPRPDDRVTPHAVTSTPITNSRSRLKWATHGNISTGARRAGAPPAMHCILGMEGLSPAEPAFAPLSRHPGPGRHRPQPAHDVPRPKLC